MRTRKGTGSVWILAGSRRGDNNQMLALAEALGMPFEIKALAYNPLHHVPVFRRKLLHVRQESRAVIKPPWPDLVLGVGPNSAPVARYIRRRSAGRTRVVQIGDPRSAIHDLDLLIATPQFLLPTAANVLSLPFPIGDPARSVTVSREEEQWLRSYPAPRRLIAIGGSTRKWRIDDKALEQAIKLLQARSSSDGGSVLAVTSPRTSRRTRRLLEDLLGDAVVDDFPRFAALLARSDEIYVTADSVSMLSEAILTGKPVGMIEISRTFRGSISRAARGLGIPSRADLSRFWRFLLVNGLIGTVEAPVASDVKDTVSMAADAVHGMLGREAVHKR